MLNGFFGLLVTVCSNNTVFYCCYISISNKLFLIGMSHIGIKMYTKISQSVLIPSIIINYPNSFELT